MGNPVKASFGILMLLACGSIAQAQHYEFTDLGTLPGAMSSIAVALNNRGEVVGSSSGQAFLWTESKAMQGLGFGPTPGTVASSANGINRRGDIVIDFESVPPTGEQDEAFILTKSGLQDLGNLGCVHLGITPSGINSSSEVVGTVYIPPCGGGGQARAYIYHDGIIDDLGTLSGPNANPLVAFSIGSAINTRGHVVGYSSTTLSTNTNVVFDGFLWTKDEGMLDLGTLPGWANYSYALGINSRDDVVGASAGSGFPQGYIWDKRTGMKGIGFLPGGQSSAALGINDRNEVVGISQYANSYSSGQHAFIWTAERGMQDLNDLIPSDSKFVLVEALAINDRGQIVGWGYSANLAQYQQIHGFLLTPSHHDDDSDGREEAEDSGELSN
jgi:probable HAF family extracellular repeat protein